MLARQAREVIDSCRLLARFSEEPGRTTRTFLSPPMRDVHAYLGAWMQRSGMSVHVDNAGNLRGAYPASSAGSPRLFIGSHLDTVSDAGAFDGVLGVVLAVALVDLLQRRPLPFSIEVVGFSEEEGVRFGIPFIGSRALTGTLDDDLLGGVDARGRSITDAIRDYGLDPSCILNARDRREGARLSGVPHRTGAGARWPRRPSWHRERHRRTEPARRDIHRGSESCRNDADARATGCRRRCGRMDRRRRGARAANAWTRGNRRTALRTARRHECHRGRV